MAFGIAIRGVAAVALSRLLKSFLFRVEPMDPATLIASIALFAGIASLACWVPSHRAARVNPVESLRYE